MPFEIEREFLVRRDDWRTIATRKIRIHQAYLASDGKVSIRIRVKNDREATLTIKSRMAERRRLELEYPVPVLEAEALIALRWAALLRSIDISFGMEARRGKSTPSMVRMRGWSSPNSNCTMSTSVSICLPG